MKFRGPVHVLAAAALLAGLAGRPAHADPVVTSITVASILLVAKAIIDDTPVAAEADHIVVEGGRFDPIKDENQADEFGLEYRPARWIWIAQPFVGAGMTTDRSMYGYVGLRHETRWGNFIITPSIAAVAYDKGHGKDLGSTWNARSGLDFEYALPHDVRIGLSFHHMSHGKLFNPDNNPGTELVGLTLSIPLGGPRSPGE